MQVRLGTVARLDGGDDPVGAVGDVGRPGGDADLVHHARRPGEHRLAPVHLSGEVQGCPAEGRPEPDQAADPVHDHQAGLAHRRGRVAPRGDEEVPGLAGAAGGPRHGDGRGLNVAPGHEVTDAGGGGAGGCVAGGRVAGGRVIGRRGRVIGGSRVRPRIADVTGQPQPGDACAPPRRSACLRDQFADMKPPRLLTHAAAGSPAAALTWHPAWQGEFQHIYLFACLRADLYLLYTGSLSCRERARVRPCAHVACAVVSGIHRQGRRGSRGRLTPRRRPGVRGHHVARCQRQPGVHRPARGRRAAGRHGAAPPDPRRLGDDPAVPSLPPGLVHQDQRAAGLPEPGSGPYQAGVPVVPGDQRPGGGDDPGRPGRPRLPDHRLRG